jgi:hypothetical protein
MPETITINYFREFSPPKLNVLEDCGFKRDEDVEEVTSTFATLVYLGRHVAFVFSFDVRDQCVDAEVVKIRNEQLISNLDGGYSADIYAYLVKHDGYRGSPTDSKAIKIVSTESKLGSSIDGWLSLLTSAGMNLLLDCPTSLP